MQRIVQSYYKPNMSRKQSKYKKVKVNVYVYSSDIPVNRFSGLYIIYLQVLELTLSQSHLPGENAAHFLQLKPFTQYQFFFPPGTLYCLVEWIRSLSKAFTRPPLRESNPRPLEVQCLNHWATLSWNKVGLQ